MKNKNLTPREDEILNLVAIGLSNKQIAFQLLLSESTVENHIHNIFEKLGVSNRCQATAIFYKYGLNSPSND